jgi:hypothetical protein
MANKRISTLDPLTTPADGDILPITDVSDTTGSAQGTTKGVTVNNLMGQAPVQSVNTATGAVVLDADDIDDSSTSHKFVTESDITNLSNLSGTNSGDQDLSSYQLQPAEGAFVDGDKTKLDGLNSADYASATHTHALDDLSDVSVSSPSSQDVVKWTGSQWEAGQVSVDVDTPLNTALRGTTNPHIGAYPNQSFKVIDNPYQSVMVVADEAGNLKLLNSLGVNNIAVGFSVVEDGVEPDIEVVSGSETYSVISGDSDSLALNGLPVRQGFNLPDIGAYPAPILISGGSIA